MNEVETNIQTTGVSRDESIDLQASLEAITPTKTEHEVEAQPTIAVGLENFLAQQVAQSTTPTVEKKTPLQLAQEKVEREGRGAIYTNEEIASNAQKELRSFEDNDQRKEEFNEYLNGMDTTIASMEDVEVIKKPQSNLEMAALMEEVELVTSCKKNNTKIPTKALKYIKVTSEPEEPTEDDPVDQAASEEDAKNNAIRQQAIEIIIDKTGMGYESIEFTEEEREKIRLSSEIRIKEITDLNLSSITVVAPTKSFTELVEVVSPSLSSTPVTLAGSRYRATVRGLSYGQLGDIILTEETRNFDRIHKQYSIIYNALGTPSIGRFESFEDFLRNTAFTDMDMLLYGLIVSTFPELEAITLVCHKCKTTFKYNYSPRTLLDLENCSDLYLDNLKSVIQCDPNEVKEFKTKSLLNTRKMVKLPFSNYYIEFGLASAYDYLYHMVDIIYGDKFKEDHPDDINGALRINSAFISMVRSVLVPNGQGQYVKYTVDENADDVINALYSIKPDDIPIITNIVTNYTDAFTPQFSFKNVKCPSCGEVTERIAADLNDLVFRKYQQLMNTVVNVKNIL